MATWSGFNLSGFDPYPSPASSPQVGRMRRMYDFAARQARRPGVRNLMFPENGMQPVEWFGFAMRGDAGNRALTFAGVRVGRGPGPRFWIPDPEKPWSGPGQFGTFGELRAGIRSSISSAPTAFSKVTRAASMIGGRFVLPIMGMVDFGSRFSGARAQGDNLLVAGAKAAAGVGASALMWTLGFKMLTNPITLAAAVPLAIGVGHIAYKNKMAEYSKEVKRTEFVGDMSAFHTGAAHTMRQRSMQSIERSYLNARSALGSEAQYRHLTQSIPFAANPAVWGRMM